MARYGGDRYAKDFSCWDQYLAKAIPPKLHGPYYRWTGFLNGKQTTKTINQEVAEECQRRIRNYRALQKKLEQIVEDAFANAPWNG